MRIEVYVGSLANDMELRITDQGDDSEPSIKFSITNEQASGLRDALDMALILISKNKRNE